ncbi:MAG: M23 family metallopeptidase [Gammaproteobacteria bacterium]
MIEPIAALVKLNGNPIFPLKVVPQDWTAAKRFFGAERPKRDKDNNVIGTRTHAGCDLMVKATTEVVAVADGAVFAIDPFLFGMKMIQVNHDGFIAVYGEVVPSDGLKPGQPVKQGDTIATVANQGSESQLHFELYITGEKRRVLLPSGAMPQDVKLKPYNRALLPTDPNPYLRQWVKALYAIPSLRLADAN